LSDYSDDFYLYNALNDREEKRNCYFYI